MPEAKVSFSSLAKSLIGASISPIVAFAVVLFAATSVAGIALVANSEIGNTASAPASRLFFSQAKSSQVLGVATYGYNQPICSQYVCLSYELLGYSQSENSFAARIDYILQKVKYGSIRVNGNKFAYNIRSSGSTNTGYNLDPNTVYIFKFYSGLAGQGKILATLKFTTPPAPSYGYQGGGGGSNPLPVPIVVSPAPTPTPTPAPATGGGSGGGTGYGYGTSTAITITSPRVGQVINKNGTVYLVAERGLYDFPNLAAFNSWGFSFSQVLPANSAEAALPVIGVVPMKLSGCNTPLEQIAGLCGSAGSLNASLDLASPISGAQLSPSSSDATLLIFKLTNGGANAALSKFDISVTHGIIENLRVYLNGANITSQSNLVSTGSSDSYWVSLSSSTVISANTSQSFAVKANILGNASGTLRSSLNNIVIASSSSPSITGLPVVGNLLTIGNSTTTTPTLTVSLTGTSSLSVTAGQTSQQVANFLVRNNSNTDTINITGLNFQLASSNVTGNFQNLKLMNGAVQIGTTWPGPYNGSSYSLGSSQGLLTIAPNASIYLNVYMDVLSTAAAFSNQSVITLNSINAVSLSTGKAIAPIAPVTGQAVTVQGSGGGGGSGGAISAAVDSASPVSSIIAGNQTKTAAMFRFTTANDAYTVSEIALSVPNTTTISAITLKDGNTILATQPASASTTFGGLNITIPSNSTKTLTVDAQLGSVGPGAGASGERVQVTLRSFESAPVSTGSFITAAVNATANNMYVYKAVPTIANAKLPTSALTLGVNTISRFSISSGAASPVAWQRLVFTYAASNQITLANPQLWDADSNTQISAVSSVDIANGKIIFDTTSEQLVSGAKTYVLKTTVGKSAGLSADGYAATGLSTGDYITTRIANPTTVWSQPTTAAGAASGGGNVSFTWSDVSAQNHSLTTADWNNDFLVKNLPSDSQTLVK